MTEIFYIITIVAILITGAIAGYKIGCNSGYIKGWEDGLDHAKKLIKKRNYGGFK